MYKEKGKLIFLEFPQYIQYTYNIPFLFYKIWISIVWLKLKYFICMLLCLSFLYKFIQCRGLVFFHFLLTYKYCNKHHLYREIISHYIVYKKTFHIIQKEIFDWVKVTFSNFRKYKNTLLSLICNILLKYNK